MSKKPETAPAGAEPAAVLPDAPAATEVAAEAVAEPAPADEQPEAREHDPADDEIVDVVLKVSLSGAESKVPGDTHTCTRAEAIRMRDAGYADFEG